MARGSHLLLVHALAASQANNPGRSKPNMLVSLVAASAGAASQANGRQLKTRRAKVVVASSCHDAVTSEANALQSQRVEHLLSS